jgi:hypothetical protein
MAGAHRCFIAQFEVAPCGRLRLPLEALAEIVRAIDAGNGSIRHLWDAGKLNSLKHMTGRDELAGEICKGRRS